MSLTDNKHWRWRRLSSNVGYIRTHTSKASQEIFTKIGQALSETDSTIRVWHTKHLFIVWEREGK